MNIQHPQAFSGFLLAKARLYPTALGIPGWLVDVLQEQLDRPLPPALAVASALLRPEYTREYTVKWMRLPSADELQGFLDLPILVLAAGESYLTPGLSPEKDGAFSPSLSGKGVGVRSLPEFQALAAGQQEQAKQFVENHLAWVNGIFQPGHIQDGVPLMTQIFRQVRGEPFGADYLRGALAAQDTFCLHNDFIRSFALGGKSI